MPLLLLTPRYTSDSRLMRLAAQEAGWETLRLGDWRVPPELAEREDLAFYGEPLLAAVIAESLPYALLEPPLDWLPGLPPELRGRDVRLTTLGEARRQAEPAFFKPADDKCFPAKVYGSGAELAGREALPDTVPVLAQEPVTWEIEFRCFVLERRVVTWSPYLRLGKLVEREDGSWPAEPEESEAALTFATRVLGDERVALPPAVALDVGRIAGRGWARLGRHRDECGMGSRAVRLRPRGGAAGAATSDGTARGRHAGRPALDCGARAGGAARSMSQQSRHSPSWSSCRGRSRTMRNPAFS